MLLEYYLQMTLMMTLLFLSLVKLEVLETLNMERA